MYNVAHPAFQAKQDKMKAAQEAKKERQMPMSVLGFGNIDNSSGEEVTEKAILSFFNQLSQ